MMTTTHVLVAASLVARPHHSGKRIAAIWLAGLLPDLSIFVMLGAAVSGSVSGRNLWRQPDGLYWQEPWQSLSAISNSIPLWISVVLAGVWLARGGSERLRLAGQLMALTGIAALAHAGSDFLVHTDDAHVQFWPFTDWRFHSPVSYYQRANYGQIAGVIEAIAGVGMAGFIAMRFRQWPARILAVLLALPYLLNTGFLLFGPGGMF